MFHRFSKIVITESSASGRAHPAVGDVGYLNNMYLFFLDKFILLDAFFFSYRSDKGKSKTRCERKRFVVDLGMTPRLKRKLELYGVPKSFFAKNGCAFNLTPTSYRLVNNVLIEPPEIFHLWRREFTRQGDLISKSKIKIPYGQIALSPTRRNIMELAGANELRCWIECSLPLLTAVLYTTANQDPSIISDLITSGKYARRLLGVVSTRAMHEKMVVEIRKGVRKNFKPLKVRALTEEVQMLRSLGANILRNCEDHILWMCQNDKDVSIYKGAFASACSAFGVVGAHQDMTSLKLVRKMPVKKMAMSIPNPVVKILTEMVIRCLLEPGDTEKRLINLRRVGVVPWSHPKTMSIAAKAEEIKRKAENSSAALNRIFEENLGL